MTNGTTVGVFILAKNEEANIGRSLESLSGTGWPVHVLDSGSTDSTQSIVERYTFAVFQEYSYTNHCNAYNEIVEELGAAYKFVMILDADMILSEGLQKEVIQHVKENPKSLEVLEASIVMCAEGVVLNHGSLCPPKPFVFATGNRIFESVGHGEKVSNTFSVTRTSASLLHDDRKPYSSFLQSQYRYSGNLVRRYREGNVSSRDSLRVKWPLLIFAVPFVSYILKLGFLDGRAGAIYALDRLIAEAIMYRQAAADRLEETNRRV